jgi:transposase
MTTQEAVRALWQQGYSKRKISRELRIHRNTVTSCLLQAKTVHTEPTAGSGSEPTCTISIPGSQPTCTISTPGSEPSLKAAGRAQEGPQGAGRGSECLPYAQIIEGKFQQGLKAKRIWQDLVTEHAFKHGYQSVKRYVAKLKQTDPQRVWRMECEPGQEAQVDYGTMYVQLAGKKRKIHFLRVTLSHTRKGYTEAMPRQDAESFIRGIENAFRHFEGCPKLLVLDNLKAGVLNPSIYDPQLNPKFASFCDHYGVVALPTRPRTPEHKGKVESAVGYVKQSAVKAKSFDSFYELNVHLRQWERTIADRRIHGTTKRQVGSHFEQAEKAALQPLPPDIFASFVEAKRSVHRDSYVEFERAFYEAPPEYIARELWVRSDGRMVRLFNLRMEQVAVHPKLKAGQFTKTLGCGGAPRTVRESLRYWEGRAADIGPETELWAKGLIIQRKEAAIRVLMGLVNQFLRTFGSAALERACAQARMHGQYRLCEVRNWLEQPIEQQSFSFLSEHEVIREMADYGRFVSFEQQN